MYLYLIPSIIGILAASLNAYGGIGSFTTLVSIMILMIMGADINKAIRTYKKGYRPNFNATNRLKQTLFIGIILVIISTLVSTVVFHQTFVFPTAIPVLEESITFYGSFFDKFVEYPNACSTLWIVSILSDILSKVLFYMESKSAIKKHTSLFL